MDAPTSHALHARIPTVLEMVRPVRRLLESLLAGEGWGEDDVADVGLVATEVLQNAVEHGSRADGRESVEVRCEVSGGEVLIEVADPGTGKGVENLLRHDVDRPPPEDASRGRGLYLVHRIARRMDRLRGPAGGSLLRVRMAPGTAP
jgi:anti-sigma regulatory factor (Ser/Thr protein kinase)